MSHNIYQNKFISFRQPAWHRLGEVTEEQYGAVEALDRIGGYHVQKHQLFTDIQRQILVGEAPETQEVRLQADKLGLVAHFDEEVKFLGICDKRYEILQPRDIANVWDMTTGAHVETMGILSEGKQLFFSTQLPTYDVVGDEIENYLLVHLSMVFGKTATITITPVRAVCQNTLSYGLSQAKSQHRIIHTSGALNRFGGLIQDVWQGATAKAEAVKQAMEILAHSRVAAGAGDEYVEQVFPYPVLNDPAEFEAAKDRTDAKRNEVLRLFEGGARGADTEAFKGTYFGLYNSVVEFVDYFSRMSKESVAFGGGAALKQHAFDTAMELK